MTVFPPISLRCSGRHVPNQLTLAFVMSVLRAANQSGVLNLALQNLSQERPEGSTDSDLSWAVVTNGVMTDGSKRRLSSPTPSDDTALEPKEIQRVPHDLWTSFGDSCGWQFASWSSFDASLEPDTYFVWQVRQGKDFLF